MIESNLISSKPLDCWSNIIDFLKIPGLLIRYNIISSICLKPSARTVDRILSISLTPDQNSWSNISDFLKTLGLLIEWLWAKTIARGYLEFAHPIGCRIALSRAHTASLLSTNETKPISRLDSHPQLPIIYIYIYIYILYCVHQVTFWAQGPVPEPKMA